MGVEKIWIIGVGRFGRLALRRLSEGSERRRFLLVDPEDENLRGAAGPDRTLLKGDGPRFLAENLRPREGPDWIIPALPIHLAAEWCLLRMGPERLKRIALPLEIEPLLPNPMRGSGGDIYVSHADFRCPDDCAEPRGFCSVTRQPRKPNMFQVLKEISVPPFSSLVIRSHQLGPGVGGYRPRQLLALSDALERSKGPRLISTACRCHGVVTGVNVS